MKSLLLACALLLPVSARAAPGADEPPFVKDVEWATAPAPEYPRSELGRTEPVRCTATIDVHRDGTANVVKLAGCEVPFVAPIDTAFAAARARWTFDDVVPPGAGDTVRTMVKLKFVGAGGAALPPGPDGVLSSPMDNVLSILFVAVGLMSLRNVRRDASGRLPAWPLVEGAVWLAAGVVMLISVLAADGLAPEVAGELSLYALTAVLLWQFAGPVIRLGDWVRRKQWRKGASPGA